MCPYARFQSVMFDPDTLVITYDAARGEPRGGRPRKADPAALGLGACVDCNICVQVCPTGIDIRNGLQFDCIGCAACIDACDQVMDKVGYPRGLIRYSNGRVLRPRILVYAALLAALATAAGASLWMRSPVKMDVIRDRASLSREVEDGRIENVYRLQLMNTEERSRRVAIGVSGPEALARLEILLDGRELTLGPTEARLVTVRVRAEPHAARGAQPIEFVLVSGEPGDEFTLREKSRFLVP
jgi:cytochrome c oxidase accessory protein FixG